MSGTSGAVSGATTGASVGAALGPWGALAGGVVGGVGGFLLGNSEAEARKQAALERARRQALVDARTLGSAQDAAGSTGVDVSRGAGSLAMHLNLMSQEFRKQADWNVRQANEGADLSNTANLFQLGSGLSSSLFKFGQANNWWMSSPGAP